MERIMIDRLRDVLAAHGRLAVDPGNLEAGDDLYASGMSSQASVNVMLAVEDTFDVEFPDELLKRSVFASMASIATAVEQLQGQQAA